MGQGKPPAHTEDPERHKSAHSIDPEGDQTTWEQNTCHTELRGLFSRIYHGLTHLLQVLPTDSCCPPTHILSGWQMCSLGNPPPETWPRLPSTTVHCGDATETSVAPNLQQQALSHVAPLVCRPEFLFWLRGPGSDAGFLTRVPGFKPQFPPSVKAALQPLLSMCVRQPPAHGG